MKRNPELRRVILVSGRVIVTEDKDGSVMANDPFSILVASGRGDESAQAYAVRFFEREYSMRGYSVHVRVEKAAKVLHHRNGWILV